MSEHKRRANAPRADKSEGPRAGSNPTSQIKHAQNETSAVVTEHAQQHEHQEKDVDYVESHLRSLRLNDLNPSQDKMDSTKHEDLLLTLPVNVAGVIR